MRAMPRLNAASDAALLILRVFVGVVIAYHGWQKFDGGIANFAGFVESLSLPAPTLLAWVVAVLELVGGVMIAVGLLARLPSVLLAIEMAITGVYVKIAEFDVGLIAPGNQPGTGAEIDFALMAAFIVIAVLGPGRLSLDAALGVERRESPAAAPATMLSDRQVA
jgi:putative oxidoreductase